MSKIPTEPIGSISRPVDLIERVARGDSEDPTLTPLYDAAIRDTIERFEATSTSRDTAFAKIQARVPGTALAEKLIGDHP
jgi:hypothetical protein